MSPSSSRWTMCIKLEDSTIKIFNPSNNLNCDITLIGHDGYVFHTAQRENGNIISFSRDKSIKIWEIINVCIQ